MYVKRDTVPFPWSLPICPASVARGIFYKEISLLSDGPGAGPYQRGSNYEPANVRFGSKADISQRTSDFRFTPESEHLRLSLECHSLASSKVKAH
jgi:hypothetical protein